MTHVSLCGRLRLEVAGEPREEQLHGRQGRLLLAFLVLNRTRPVRRDELIEALWAQQGTPPSDGALSPVLSRLRRVIAPGTISGRDALTLVLPEPVVVDVEEARDALARARGTTDPAEALEAAREAAALLAPGLLPGLEAPWLDEERDRLADLRVEALQLTARAAAGHDHAVAENAARTAVELAPFRESAWAALIVALRAQGNIAEALRAYDELRHRLREELGTAPGPELVALHGELLAESDEPPPPAARAARSEPLEPAPLPAEDLVEREEELRAIGAAFAAAAAGRGGVIMFEGAAGIGKTRLLTELASHAATRDALVLEARSGLLEREYAFGVVRQLLEPVADAALLEGPAAPARTVLGDAETTGRDGSFTLLNALFHVIAQLAAVRPVVLCIDDLQWSDPASLRFTCYLARRIARVPVLVAATVRTGEPEADEALLGELAQEPVTVALSPLPLTGGATAQLVRDRLGETADAAFTAACQDVTAGNPLLLTQLLKALEADRVSPDAAQEDRVRELGPRAVARAVLLRLSRLQPPGREVARAVAVLGEQPALPVIAALAGTDEPSAAQAVQALVRAEVLRGEGPLGFVHPLIRDAVYGELPAAARALEHDRAARLLAELGGSPEQVAAQLLLAPPRADPWVVEQLRAAAAGALRRGAPDAAMPLLERAQREPPPPDQRAALALELGGSAAYLRGPAGVEPLRRAYAELTDPVARGRAATSLSHLLLFVSSPQEGVAVAARAAAELPPEHKDVHDALRTLRLVGAAFGAVDPAEFRTLDDVRGGPRGSGPGSRALTAMTALATALTCGPAAEASALAREAFSEGLDVFELTAPIALGSAALALGDPAEGLGAIRLYAEYAARNGEILSAIGADLWGGVTQVWAGDLPAAMELLERAHEGERLWGTKLDAVMAYSAAFTALARLERGDPTGEVAATLHRVQADDARPDGARFWLASLAELALAEGRPEDALDISVRLEPTRPPDTHPVWAPWRGLRARALAQLGRTEEGTAFARDELDLARRVGAPWVVGRGLRILAELRGAEGVEEAREAVRLLTGQSALLELAKAHVVLGDALAASAQPGADHGWAEGARLAERCGAERLRSAAAGRSERAVERAGS